jgi:hypothetical protein
VKNTWAIVHVCYVLTTFHLTRLNFFALSFNLNVNVYNCSNYCARKNFFERAMSAGISCKQVCTQSHLCVRFPRKKRDEIKLFCFWSLAGTRSVIFAQTLVWLENGDRLSEKILKWKMRKIPILQKKKKIVKNNFD